MENARLVVSPQRAAQLRDLVLGLEALDARQLAEGLAARG
jgi:hypothetical protein